MTLPRLSARAVALSPSPTLSISARANAMKAEGHDVISFGAGEPDFNTPEPVCQAAIEAIRSGFTKYTPTSGTPELKALVAEKLWRDNAIQVDPDQVVVSCGAKQCLYNALMVLIDPGDEVLLLAPYWMTYAEQVRLAGGIPVVVAGEESRGYVPDIEAVRAAVTSRTKALILNSPSNPTGAVFPREIIKALAALAMRHDFYIVSDEIYEKLVYDDCVHHSPASLGAEALERTVTIHGCSKSFAMTGWRIGYAAAPRAIAKAMSNLQDQVTSNPTSFAQRGAEAALRMARDAQESMRQEFQARRDLVVRLLRQIPGITTNVPQGAFYVLPNVGAFLGGKIAGDPELASYLLEKALVATVPGSVFGGEGSLRLSYATSRDNIERGVARLGEALSALRS